MDASCDESETDNNESVAELEYDTTEMSDGVNISNAHVDPWSSSQPPPGKPKFSATESHREQVMGQLSGLKRRAAMKHSPAW